MIRTAAPGAWVMVGLLAFRWVAGIAENHLAPGISEAAAMAVLAGLALLFAIDFRLARSSLLLTAGLLAWAMFATASLLANPGAAPREALALLALLGLYLLFANGALLHLRQPAEIALAGRFMSLFILGGALLSLAQILGGGAFVAPGRPDLPRAFGSDVHPVSFGIQLVAAATGLEIVRLKLGRRAGAVHVLTLGLGALALYLTYARTAWAMAALIPVLVMMARGRPATRAAAVALAISGALVLGLTGRFADLASLPLFLDNFSFTDAVFDYRFIDNSVSWRFVNWAYGLQQALAAPVLGHGPGQSAEASYFQLEMHSIFLETFFEGGALGLAAFVLTLAGLLRIHLLLPSGTGADRRARSLANAFGVTLLLAVSLSTSLVDQLMTILLYLLLLAASAVPAAPGPAAPARTETARNGAIGAQG